MTANDLLQYTLFYFKKKLTSGEFLQDVLFRNAFLLALIISLSVRSAEPLPALVLLASTPALEKIKKQKAGWSEGSFPPKLVF